MALERAEVGGGVYHGGVVRPLGREIGHRGDLKRPGLPVCNVQMETVHLVEGGGGDLPFYVADGEEVAGHVEVDAAMGEAGRVEDVDGSEERVDMLLGRVEVEELAEGGEGVGYADAGVCGDAGCAVGGKVEGVGFVDVAGWRSRYVGWVVFEKGNVDAGDVYCVEITLRFGPVSRVEFPGEEVLSEERLPGRVDGVVDDIIA